MRLTHPAVLAAGGVLGFVVVLTGLTYLLNGAAVPRGVTVAGVDIGGKSRGDAGAALRAGLSDRLAGPVQLSADGTAMPLDPAAATLALDVDRTVDDAVGGGPLARLAGLFGRGKAVDPHTTVDQVRLAAAITAAAGSFGTPAVEGSVRYEGLTPIAVLPKAGRGVLPDAAAAVVRRRWLDGKPVAVPVGELTTTVSAAAVQAAVAGPAAAAVSGPVSLTTAGAAVVLAPADIAAVLRFEPGPGGSLRTAVDGGALLARLGARLGTIQNEPVSASFVVNAGVPSVVPSRDGRTVDAAALEQGLLAALAAPARTSELAVKTTPATFTTEQATALGIKEQIGTFTTNHPCCAPRVSNIHRIADLVQNTVVQPGQTYSLNGAIGERTTAKGFVSAPQILNGDFVDGVGGGISQFTTTMYNATFFAGMVDVEHQPHSYYISRYPPGREATITYPKPDLKWKNDSPTGVLIRTSYTGTSVTVTLYGTKLYDEVISQASPRTRVTPSPQVQKPAGPTCKQQSGTTGFDITITRLMKRGGATVATSTFTNRYLPEPTITCVVAPVVPPPVLPPVIPEG